MGLDLDLFEEAHTYAARARMQMQAMRKALEASLDTEPSSQWERRLEQPDEPEPTPESVPLMEEPEELWEVKRLSEIRRQMEANWPARPWSGRKPWRTR